MSPFSLAGKVAAITGAGSGIGKNIATEFGAAEATVLVTDRNGETAQVTAAEIVSAGGCARALTCDVRLRSQVEDTFREIFSTEGRLDILVNNAGIAHIGTVENTSEEDFDRVFQVNVKGAYHCIHSVIGRMKGQGGGVILNIASVAASVGIKERFAYSVSKGAILAMTYQVARDYVNQGIRCNSISPARIHTPLVDGYLRQNYPDAERAVFDELSKTQPIGRMGQPGEVAALARYLCSDAASFITGTDFPIDGGFIRLNS